VLIYESLAECWWGWSSCGKPLSRLCNLGGGQKSYVYVTKIFIIIIYIYMQLISTGLLLIIK